MKNSLIIPLTGEHTEFLRDESRRVGSAESISFPVTENDVKEVLALTARRGVPVTVQGARTGIVGGAVPAGGHVMNLSRMRRIRGMRRDERTGRVVLGVEPGVLLSDIDERLRSMTFDTNGWSEESRGVLEEARATGPYLFTPDPTETSASIGGMVAGNASGARSFHYGPTRRHVEALRVVLADGRVAALRRGEQHAQGRSFALRLEEGGTVEGELPYADSIAVKNAAGYFVRSDMDLLDLFIGMEGTLGVVTVIELGLIVRPRCMWAMMAFMPDQRSALELVRALRSDSGTEIDGVSPARPAALEFFNGSALELLRAQKAENAAFGDMPAVPPEYHTAIYIEYHGADDDQVSDAILSASAAMLAFGGNEDATWVASDERELERFKRFRHAVPESVNLLIDRRRAQHPGLTKLGTDMAVPNERLVETVDMYDRDLAAGELESVIFGHVGDNHLHVNILPTTEDEYERGKHLCLAWAAHVVSIGGSVSAEHGIGKLKPQLLRIMYGNAGVENMRRLKRVFDPREMLNPGNLFG
jgi:D-lactate dehydrogenase (cytochrome)